MNLTLSMDNKNIPRPLIITGYIKNTHSLDGTLVVESCSGDFIHFKNLKIVWLAPRGGDTPPVQYQVASFKINCGWLKLQGIDTLDAAAKLKGYAILVEKENAHKLSRDEWYIDDLKNCNITYNGEILGVVNDVIDGGNGQLLEVKMQQAVNNVKYVPLDYRYIKSVDVIQKIITLKVPWILE